MSLHANAEAELPGKQMQRMSLLACNAECHHANAEAEPPGRGPRRTQEDSCELREVAMEKIDDMTLNLN